MVSKIFANLLSMFSFSPDSACVSVYAVYSDIFCPFFLFFSFHYLFVFFMFYFSVLGLSIFSMPPSHVLGTALNSELIVMSADDDFNDLDALLANWLTATLSTCSRWSSATNATVERKIPLCTLRIRRWFCSLFIKAKSEPWLRWCMGWYLTIVMEQSWQHYLRCLIPWSHWRKIKLEKSVVEVSWKQYPSPSVACASPL